MHLLSGSDGVGFGEGWFGFVGVCVGDNVGKNVGSPGTHWWYQSLTTLHTLPDLQHFEGVPLPPHCCHTPTQAAVGSGVNIGVGFGVGVSGAGVGLDIVVGIGVPPGSTAISAQFQNSSPNGLLLPQQELSQFAQLDTDHSDHSLAFQPSFSILLKYAK